MESESYDSYQASVPARWGGAGIEPAALTVYASRAGEVTVPVGGGQASLARYGEPLTAYAEGFELLEDWDKISGDMSPGQWVCTAKPKEG